MEPNPGWDIWFAASLPLGIICILTTWAILLVYFRPARSTPRINVIKSQPHGRPSYSQIWVTLVCLATIALWCSETALESFWGGDGTIAIIPFVLLFGTNMLNKLDLNNFLWSVLTLGKKRYIQETNGRGISLIRQVLYSARRHGVRIRR